MLNFSSLSCKKIALPTFAVFLLLTLLTVNTFAAVVTLNSGKVIEGEILLRNDDMIKIDAGAGIPITYYLDEIKVIEDEPLVAAEIEQPVEPPPTDEKSAPQAVTPAKEVATLDDVDVSKEPLPPPAIQKPKTVTPPADSSVLTPSKREEHQIMEIISKEIGTFDERATSEDRTTKIKNALTRKANEYIESQTRKFKGAQSYFQAKLPSIKEKLNAVPVRVRRDVLILTILLMVLVYVFVCFPLMQIAKKLDRKHAWLIWIPIIQIFYFVYLAGKPPWWIIFFAVPVINIFMVLLLFVDILKLLGKSFWLIILIIIPGVNIFTLWYLAISRIKEVPFQRF